LGKGTGGIAGGIAGIGSRNRRNIVEGIGTGLNIQ